MKQPKICLPFLNDEENSILNYWERFAPRVPSAVIFENVLHHCCVFFFAWNKSVLIYLLATEMFLTSFFVFIFQVGMWSDHVHFVSIFKKNY